MSAFGEVIVRPPPKVFIGQAAGLIRHKAPDMNMSGGFFLIFRTQDKEEAAGPGAYGAGEGKGLRRHGWRGAGDLLFKLLS